MAVFRLPFVKSLVSSLSGISRISSAQFCRPLSSSVSSVNLERPNFERNVDNIVYSRHDDCTLHDLTVAQRFFDQASLWSNNIAVVNIPFAFKFDVLITSLFRRKEIDPSNLTCCKFSCLNCTVAAIEKPFSSARVLRNRWPIRTWTDFNFGTSTRNAVTFQIFVFDSNSNHSNFKE